MMHMTFYWGIKATILFDFWKTDSILNYSLTLLACFLFGAFYQYMEDLRLGFFAADIIKKSEQDRAINAPFIPPQYGVGGHRVSRSTRVIISVLFGVNSGLAYMLMLAVMSFNWGVFIAIVLGFGFGYFCFRAKEYEALIVEDACACS